MTETKRRIKEYKKALPRLKEQLIAVTLLMAMSLTMLTTVSFAWLSLSTNPEVSNVNTSIVSNGNLEIALAKGLEAPGASKVGDGNLADLLRNLTWGNVVNLSDTNYGLDNLVLRPALLNESTLIDKPLYGPVYYDPEKDGASNDKFVGSGRVIDMNTNFGYAKWDPEKERFTSTTDDLFKDNMYGVRAITSMKYGEAGDNAVAVAYNQKLDAIESLNASVKNKFNAVANTKENQEALAALMTGYMVENKLKLGNAGAFISDSSIEKGVLTKCIDMYEAIKKCFEDEAEVVAKLLSLQAEVNGVKGADGGFLTIDKQAIMGLPYDKKNKTAKNAIVAMGFTAAKGGVVDNIDSFLYDYNILKADVVRLEDLADSFGTNTSVLWKDSKKTEDGTKLVINSVIDNLVNVFNCWISDEKGEVYSGKISGVGATMALNLKDKYCMTEINNGILYNFHSFIGGGILTSDYLVLQVYAMGSNNKIYTKIKTSSTLDYFTAENKGIEEAIISKHGQPPLIANDTYGFAVDLWVRTNAANTYLTLEGNVLTETKQEPVMGKDADGNEVYIYTISVKAEGDGTGESLGGGALGDIALTQSSDVYKKEVEDENGNKVEKIFYADNHAEVTAESLGLAEGESIPTPIQKIEDVEYVIGYEGENRIWNGVEHSGLSVDSSTQGSGSCYVFYAETPVDQERSLSLLKSMKVAFINDKGELLAKAYMDSDRHYAESGKVIVPLVLSTESVQIGNDINGDPLYAITALEQNVATRITAIVYLDGAELTNDDVLASADIRGKINIQFGSSAALYPLMNEELYNAELVASLDSLSKTEFDYDTLPDGEKMETVVKVRIEGAQPTNVTANFIRRINATQGSPEGSFVLTDADGDGVWEGTYEFLYPGTYILRSVYIDGTEKDLRLSSQGNFPTVTVKGFTISSVSQLDKRFVMTDESTHIENLSIRFASDDPKKMPKTVLGKFIRDDGVTVNVNFAYDTTSTSWTGVANFVSSGTYMMQYLILDGQYVELAEGQQREIELILGMRVHVQTDSPTTMVYGDPSTPETLQVKVQILDNNGDVIPNLANTDLYYGMSGTEPLHAKLTWDTVEYYEGEFPTSAGTWNFSHLRVKMGENVNTLTNVNSDAPVFTVIPPTPPTFISAQSEDENNTGIWFLKTDSEKGLVSATLKDATSAVVVAKIVNADDPDEIYYVYPKMQSGGGFYYTSYGTENGETVDHQVFQFVVPDDGLWTIEAVSVYNVFDSNSTLHPLPTATVDSEDAFATGLVFDSTSEDVKVAVLSQNNIDVNFSYNGAPSLVNEKNKTIALGKNANGEITSTFMQTVNVSDNVIRLTFTDENDLISRGYFKFEDVSMGYEYGPTSEEYGGYTSSAFDSLYGTKLGTFNFVATDSTNTSFVLNNGLEVNFQYAAKYIAIDLVFSIGSEYSDEVNGSATISEPSGAYAFEVWSKKPYVKFTATNPAAGTEFNGINAAEDNNVTRKNVISNDGYSVTCYYQGEITSSGGCNSCSGYTASKATTGIYDIGSNYSSATCTIVSKGEGSDITFTYSPTSQFNEQSIGSTKGTGDNAERLGIGTNATATQLIVKDANGMIYTFTLVNPLYATATE